MQVSGLGKKDGLSLFPSHEGVCVGGEYTVGSVLMHLPSFTIWVVKIGGSVGPATRGGWSACFE